MTVDEWKIIAAVASPCVALLALVVSVIAFAQARKTMRAQTFLAVLKTGQDIELSKWMDFIRGLPAREPTAPPDMQLNDYRTFQATASADQQNGVRSVVEYFNHLAHLVKYGYLTKKHVIRLYWPTLGDIRERLLPWWLTGFREQHDRKWYFETFEWLVEEAKRYR